MDEDVRGKKRDEDPVRKSDDIVRFEGTNETLRSLLELQEAVELKPPICETFRDPTFDCTKDKIKNQKKKKKIKSKLLGVGFVVEQRRLPGLRKERPLMDGEEGFLRKRF